MPQMTTPGLVTLILSLSLIFRGSALVVQAAPQPSTPAHRLPSTVYLSSPDGAKVFKQWCSSCHGDRGQGLTAAWRAEWPEGKQNCWQSKCHAANHPPDGFSFPKNVPAVIGQGSLTKFNTAQDLYTYIRGAMPYWSPNLLSDEEYQAITVFLVTANQQKRGYAPITSFDNLAAISLQTAPQKVALPTPIPEPVTYPLTSYSLPPTPYSLLPTPWLMLGISSGLVGLASIVGLIYLTHKKG